MRTQLRKTRVSREQVREARRLARTTDMTQRAIAAAVGMHYYSVNEYLTGRYAKKPLKDIPTRKQIDKDESIEKAPRHVRVCYNMMQNVRDDIRAAALSAGVAEGTLIERAVYDLLDRLTDPNETMVFERRVKRSFEPEEKPQKKPSLAKRFIAWLTEPAGV
jgi:hypothetical protein